MSKMSIDGTIGLLPGSTEEKMEKIKVGWDLGSEDDPVMMEGFKHVMRNRLAYHNENHLKDIYKFFDDNHAPYSHELAQAVFWHDAIYDKCPHKESRSALAFNMEALRLGSDVNISAVQDIIDRTVNHSLSECKTQNEVWMIMADVSGLTSNSSAVINFTKIMEESMVLYDIDVKTFADASLTFMQGLMNRMESNHQESGHDPFWLDVCEGIETTMQMCTWITND